MHNIDTLLIAHNVMPTLVSGEDKKMLSQWIGEAESGELESFLSFLGQMAKNFTTNTQTLGQCADLLLSHVLETAKATENPIGTPERLVLFTQKIPQKVLVAGHLNMLNALENAIRATPPLTAQAAVCLPPNLITELTLRLIALKEAAPRSSLCESYRALFKSATDAMQGITQLSQQLTNAVNLFVDQLSHISTTTSQAVTAVNRGRSAPIEYQKLLQQHLLELHTLAERIRYIRKEIDHVQIPDVL